MIKKSGFSILGLYIPYWLGFISIMLLASVLRLYNLENNPPSPYWEEVALGYDAYSIAQTGKDQHSNPYPVLAFPSYGDYKPSGYFYAIAPFTKIFGLSVLSIRLPSALAGIFTVALLYLIGKELFDEKTGLCISFLFAVQPWSLQFSRAGFEVNFATMLVVLGAYFLVKSRLKPWFLPFAVVGFGLSMYTYHATRLFGPLMGLLGGLILIFLWLRKGRSQQKIRNIVVPAIVSLSIALVFVLPFIINIHNAAVDSRFSQTTVFSDPSPVLQSNAQIALHGNTTLSRILYHRYWYYASTVATDYLSHFSFRFLFLRGDGNLRHSTVHFGLLYPVEAVFILLCFYLAIRKRDVKILLPTIWILLAAIPPALVLPTPHALRFLLAAPAFAVLSGYGLSYIIKRNTRLKYLPRVSALVILVLFIAFYLHWYHTGYPIEAANDWQYGYKQLYKDIAKDQKKNEQIYITREQGRPSMYYLFYTNYSPRLFQKIEPSLPKDQLEYLQIGNYHFIDSIPSQQGLFATSLHFVPLNAKILDTITQPSGKIVWVIWRRN